MMDWLRKNKLTILFNLLALAVLTTLITRDTYGPIMTIDTTSPLFQESGKWAIRFLLICLLMTPLNTLLGWRGALRLRKPAGLWAFGFAVLHILSYTRFQPLQLGVLVAQRSQPFIYMGITAFSILSLLAITSNRRAMRWLGKSWKRLHRLVYAAAPLAILHAVIGFSGSKTMLVQGDGLVHELQVYLVVMVVLLALRLPVIKSLVNRRKRQPVHAPVRAESEAIRRDIEIPLPLRYEQPEAEIETEQEPMFMS